MTRCALVLVPLILWTLACLDSHAQRAVSTKGKEFWLGFMDNHDPSQSDSLILFVSSEFNTTGTVSVPQTGYMQSFSVAANVTTKLYIPLIYEHDLSETIEGKGILVETLEDVALFAVNFQDFTPDGTKILPTKSLGTDYRVIAWEGFNGWNWYSELLVVATEDGTQIEITPSVTTAGGAPAGVPFIVQLDRGESYLVKAQSSFDDLSGSTVVGTDSSGDCRPFSVFSGSECANVPSWSGACDHLFEQNFSTDMWGDAFHIVPFLGSNGYTYRIMALENGTSVTVNGGTPINLTAGQYVTYNGVSTASCVQSNKPINVTQYMESFFSAGVGDPSMMILNHKDQKIDNITFSTVEDTATANHVINVIMKTAHTSQLTLDGVVVGSSVFTPFPSCPTTSYAQINITSGSHTLDADSGFTAYLYGTMFAKTYAYSLGSTTTIDIDSVYCVTDSVTIGTTEPLFGAWWTTLSQPNDTVAIGNTIQVLPTSSELYILRGYSLLTGCLVEKFYNVEIPIPLTLEVTQSADTVCRYQEVQLTTTVSPSGNYNYTWTPAIGLDDPYSANPIVPVMDDIQYVLTVTSLIGCAYGSDTVDLYAVGGSITTFDATTDKPQFCGVDTAQLNAVVEEVLFEDPLNTITNAALWNTISGGMVSLDCGSVSGDALYFNGGGTRSAETVDMDVSDGGTVYYYIKIGSGAAPCDDAEFGEDVVLEFSTNGGGAWTTINTHYEYNTLVFTYISVAIPPAAQTTSTRFRWRQVANSGAGQDNWALDQVLISRTEVGGFQFTWTPPAGLSSTTAQSPLGFPITTTQYIVSMVDTNSGCNYADSVTLEVGQPFTLTTTDDTVLCQTSGVPLSAVPSGGTGHTYVWSPDTTLSSGTAANPLASPLNTVTYHVTVTSEQSCTAIDSVTVTVPSLAAFAIDPTTASICVGDTAQVTASFLPVVCGTNGSICDAVQDSVQVGTGVFSSSSPAITPFYSFSGKRTQMIYTAAELAGGTAGGRVVKGIAFQTSGFIGNPNEYTDFEIRMKCTSTSVSTGNFETGTQVVFTAKPVIVTAGWNYFTFDNTFDWDGVSNVIVDICYDNVNAASSTAVMCSILVNPMVTYQTSLAACQEASGFTTMTRPMIQFNYCQPKLPDVVYTWSPSTNVNDVNDPDAFLMPTTNTLYTLNALDTAVGCIYTDDIYTSVINPNFSAGAGNDTTLCSTVGHQLQVTENSGGAVSIQWQPGSLLNDSTIANPTMTADTSVTFIVYVGDSAGCATATDTITITSQGNPTLQIISDTSVCEGDSVQLWVNGANTYSWSPAASLDNAASNMPWASPATTTTYTVTGTDNFGCQSTTTVDVSVTPFETVFLGNDTSVCPGETVELQAPAGFASYQWQDNSNGTSFTVTTAGTYWVVATNPCGQRTDTIVVSNFVNTPVEIGPDTTICFGQQVNLDAVTYDQYTWSNTDTTQTITISDSGLYYVDVVDANGCTSSDSMTLSVSANPSFSLRSDTIICAPDSITIGATLAFTSYDWSTGDTTSHITVFNSDNYILTITNMFGCSSSDTVAIGGVQPLIPDLGNDTTICDGQTVTLSTGISADSYLWSNANVSATISATDSSTYWVQTTDSNQCVASDTVIVHVLQPPSLELGNDTSVCSPETVVLYATSGMTSYNWSDGSTSDSLVVTMSDTVWVAISSANGCTSSDTIIVTVNTPPTVNLGNDTAVCSGQSVNLDAGHPGSMYNWSNAAGTQQISVTVDNEYWVVVTDGNNCTGSDTVDVTVHTLPTVNTNSDTTICEGQSVSLTATGASQYQWSPGTDLSATTGAMVVSTPSSDISYSVVGTDTNGCVGSANVSITVINIPPVSISGDTVCQGQTVTLNAGNQHTGYLWSNAAVTNSITVNTSGDYWVVASNQCGSVSDTATVLIAQAPVVSLGNDTTVCANTGYRLSVPNDPWHSYQWSTGDNVNWIEPENPGSFTLTVTNQFNCSSTTSIDLGMKWLPELKLPTDTFLCSDNGASQLLVDLTGLELDSLRWNTGNREEVLTIRQPGNYQVLAYHFCGTQSEGLTVDEEFCECNVYVPSGFSPNKDGLNDILRPLFKCEYVDFTFSVFNRWGQKVYETSERNEGWDGFFKERQQPMGVYLYHLEVGVNQHGNARKLYESGNVTLLR